MQYLYLLRVVASVLVVLTHVVSGLILFQYKEDNFPAFLLLMNAFSRGAVPIFVMITGVLFLSKSTFNLRQRLRDIIVPMIIWTVIYLFLYRYILYPVDLISYGDYLSTLGLKRSLVFMFFHNQGIVYHLWYLYMIVGIYLAMPFLQKIAQNSAKNELRYGLLLWLAFTIGWNTVVTFQEFFPQEFPYLSISLPIFSDYIGYLFLGYYLHYLHGRNTSTQNSAWRMSAWLLMYILISFIMLIRLQTENFSELIIPTFDNLAIYVLIQSISIFYVIKYSYKSFPLFQMRTFQKIIKKLSSLSFSAYLVHAMVLAVMRHALFKYFPPRGVQIHAQLIIELFSTIMISYLIAYLISLLPKRIARVLGA
nr:acyltransferase family protein [Entomospira culicis]